MKWSSTWSQFRIAWYRRDLLIDVWSPAGVAPIVRFDAQRSGTAPLHEAIAREVVLRVRRRCEAHRANVVWTRHGADRVRARLPDARREIQTRFRVRYTVPI